MWHQKGVLSVSRDFRNPLGLLGFVKKGGICTFLSLLIYDLLTYAFGLVEVRRRHGGKSIGQHSAFLYSDGSIYKIYSPCE